MSDYNQLKIQFVESLKERFEDDEETLGQILSWILVHELARNEKIYDQRRYDYVFDGLQQALGYTRYQLHKEIVEFKGCRSLSGPYSSFKDLMTQESKEILLKALTDIFLARCEDQEFKDYLKGKVESHL